jgi:tRNA G18 (ribose-2'-O)-methylase SpoU
METITGFNIHRGCLALVERPAPQTIDQLIAADATRLLALEGVGNPDNVGGLFRTARAFQVDGVVLGPGAGDPLYRKAIRVSCGASLVVPFASPHLWPGALSALADAGFTVVALTPAADAPALEDMAARWRAGDRLVVLVGAEGPGLTAAAQQHSTCRARIPIDPSADSLNVVVAAGIALQRLR